jgi:hypothetical protein
MRSNRLQEHYRQQKLHLITEKARALDARRRLLEALDTSDLENANASIGKLKQDLGPLWDRLPALGTGLQSAREDLVDASSDIQSYEGGFKGFLKGMTTKAGAKIATKMTNVFTIITAVNAGLKAVPQLLQSISIEVADPDGGAKEKMNLIDFAEEADEELQKKSVIALSNEYGIDLKRAQGAIVTAMRPKGLMGLVSRVLGKGGIPYIDEVQFAEEVLRLPLDELMALGRAASKIDNPIEQSDLQQVSQAAAQDQEGDKTPKPEETASAAAAAEPTSKAKGKRPAEEIIRTMDDARKKILIDLLKKYPPGQA